jgi:hypothetical protein
VEASKDPTWLRSKRSKSRRRARPQLTLIDEPPWPVRADSTGWLDGGGEVSVMLGNHAMIAQHHLLSRFRVV